MPSSDCRFCGSPHLEPPTKAADFDTGTKSFDLVRCSHCEAARISPFPAESELAAYYALSYYGGGEEKFHPALEWLTRTSGQRRARRLLDLPVSINGQPRVLDIGCGRGNLLRAFAALGCECHGVERPDFPAPANDPAIHYHLESLTANSFEAGSFDLIVIWHVLEHLYEPAETLKLARGWLKPGGVLVVAVPNIGSRQALWFGPDWFHLDLPRHLWHFSSESLNRKWDELGLEKRSASGLSLEQNPYGFIQSVANRFLPGRPNALYGAIKSRSWLRLVLWAPFVALLLPFALLESLVSAGEKHGATIMHAVRKPG
jgi:SAM-dependent methyltransferase